MSVLMSVLCLNVGRLYVQNIVICLKKFSPRYVGAFA